MKLVSGIALGLLLTIQTAAAVAPDCNLVSGWAQKGEARQYTPDNLYDYMDGGSEGYFIYGFVRMNGVTCVAGEVRLVMDISELTSPDMAWGLFRSFHDPRVPTEKIGTVGQVTPTKGTFCKDKYYVEITAEPTGQHGDTLRAFLVAMEKRMAGKTEPPTPVSWFPQEKLTPDSLKMVPESVLGLGALPTGYVAEYSYGKAFLVLNESAEAAGAALAKVRNRFPDAAQGKVGEESFTGTDKYLGKVFFFRKGSYIAGFSSIEGVDDPAPLAAAFAARLP